MTYTYITLGLLLAVVLLMKPAILWLIFQKLLKSSEEKKYFSLYEAMYEMVSKRVYKAFATIISENSSWENLMNNIANNLMKAFEGDGYSVLLTPENKEWHYIAWPPDYDKDDLTKIARILQKEEHSNIHEVIERKEVVVIDDTRKYDKWKKIGKAGNLGSWLGIPLMSNDKVLGVLSVDFMEKKKIDKWKKVVAEMLIKDIETINKAYKDLLELIYEPNVDPVTKNLNKNALDIDLKRYSQTQKGLGIVYIKISNFVKLSRIYGQSVMIETIIKSINKLEEIIRDKGKIYSISLEELAILVPNPIPGLLLSLKRRITAEFLRVIDVEKNLRKFFIRLDLKIGIASYPEEVQDPEELLEEAIKNAENNT